MYLYILGLKQLSQDEKPITIIKIEHKLIASCNINRKKYILNYTAVLINDKKKILT